MPNLADIIEPMPGKLAVQVTVRDEITPNGLYVPDTIAGSLNTKPTQGRIIAIGDEALEESEVDLKIDDVVIFGKYSGTEIKYQPDRKLPAEKIIILKFGDILARFRMPEESENVTVRGS
jgi:chaperonin GroES